MCPYHVDNPCKHFFCKDSRQTKCYGEVTTKKSSCPSIFFPMFLQTAVIDKLVLALFENASVRTRFVTTQNDTGFARKKA